MQPKKNNLKISTMIKKIFLLAVLSVFTFGCSSDDDSSGNSQNTENPENGNNNEVPDNNNEDNQGNQNEQTNGELLITNSPYYINYFEIINIVENTNPETEEYIYAGELSDILDTSRIKFKQDGTMEFINGFNQTLEFQYSYNEEDSEITLDNYNFFVAPFSNVLPGNGEGDQIEFLTEIQLSLDNGNVTAYLRLIGYPN